MPAESQFKVTADDIQRYDWKSTLEQAASKECDAYFTAFIRAIEERKIAGDDLGERVYRLLAAVASFHPNYDGDGNPYGPLWTKTNGARAISAEDLTKEDLAALPGVFSEIIDPEFRARVGDVLWESDRNYKAAQEAVRAFLASANNHKSADLWPPYAERIERAIDLAARLGFGKPLHLEMLAEIEAAIEGYVKEAGMGAASSSSDEHRR